jgi:autotransporter-associated beta strand protein
MTACTTTNRKPSGWARWSEGAGKALRRVAQIENSRSVRGWTTLTLIAFLCAYAPGAGAATCNWSATPANGNLSNAANWDVPPQAGDTLNFGSSTITALNNDFAAASQVGDLIFAPGSSAFTITGNSITLTNSVVNNGTSLQTINIDMTTTSLCTFATFTNGSDIALGGVLSGNNGVINKTGAGTLTLSGNNTFTSGGSGSIVINAGIIKVGAAGTSSSGPLGADNATLFAGNGAALDLNGFTLNEMNIRVRPGNNLGNPTDGLINSSPTPVTFNGLVRLSFDGSINASAGAITISQPVQASSGGGGNRNLTLGGTTTGSIPGFVPDDPANSLIKKGTGTWTITGASSYTNGTIIRDGTLLATSASVSGTGTGTVTLTASGSSGSNPTFGGGTGRIAGTVTVNGPAAGVGGTWTPTINPAGVNAAGTFNVSDVTYTGAGRFVADLSSISSYDQLNSSGTVDLNSSNNAVLAVNILPGASISVGDTFTIITCTTALNNTFSGLTNNARIFAGGHTFRINYAATTVTLTCTVPDSYVGLNFLRSESYNQLLVSDVAGAVVPQTNWNNLICSPDGSAGPITNGDGNVSGLTVSWSGFEGNYSTMASPTNGDQKLMFGYGDNNAGSAAIAVSNIAAGSYDAYVYFGSAGDGNLGTVGIDGSTTYAYSTYDNSQVFPSGYTVATSIPGDPVTNSSNYAVWTNMTGSNFTVTITKVSGNSGVCGIQLILHNVQTIAPSLAINGVPISWLISHYGVTNDYNALALSDSDGDGAPAWKEYWAGTDPTNPQSVLKIVNANQSGQDIKISWSSVTGEVYSVYRTENLWATWPTGSLMCTWQTVPLINNMPADPSGTNQFTDVSALTNRSALYRIRVQKLN